ncbi:hypothetical protein Ahy_B06g083665 isoform C [Arachis hypogaea]|uniref:Spt6 acidic N-terminal domain-containing protein n=1 Tax=Arachis hypogaea TaxID=3818 RepID=A0A444YQE4_ARAHY|nr:hypothetical protein Ahy_B06g083665 isoform C [Arachis hypogaea]
MMLCIVTDTLLLFLLNSEGQDEYENDGFIVDDVEDEDEQDEEERPESDDERQKKKKPKKKVEYVLDEDDYDLHIFSIIGL